MPNAIDLSRKNNWIETVSQPAESKALKPEKNWSEVNAVYIRLPQNLKTT